MDAGDRRLFEEAVRRAVGARPGAALDAALAELGWSDAFAEDPQLAVSALFEAQGAAHATSRALGEVVVAAAGIDRTADAVVVLPMLDRRTAPGQVVDGRISVDGLAMSRPHKDLVVVARAGDRHVAVRLGRHDVVITGVGGMDPALELLRIATAHPVDVDVSECAGADWEAAVAAGHVALAHELVGVSRAMLQLARDHAVGRVQFDRPIAAFQAVRHRLSDSLVAIEAAEAAVTAAWDMPSPTTAMLAKAVAGGGARTVARHAQQVLAGMGFTLEHPLHRHLRRALVLDALLGGTRALTADIGAEALRSRRIPEPLPL